MEQLKVVQVNVGEPAKVVEVDNTLEALQAVVGGYIEVVHLHHGIIMICNELGIINNLPENFTIHHTETHNGEYRDELRGVILGNVVFVASEGDEFSSLNEEQIKIITNGFSSDGTKFSQTKEIK